MAFRLPTRAVVGPGSLARLTEIARTLPGGRVALVSDPGVVAAGWTARAAELLVAAGLDPLPFTDVEPNPRIATVDRMAMEARPAGCTAVVAIGGGSALDAGKALALLLTNPGSARDYEGRNRFGRAAAPLVAVPTTCGTGSEVTWVSVLTDPEEGRKISVKGDGMFPTWAVVDADTLASAPRELVATTAMDALTHAVEAVVSRASNPVSDALAGKAVALIAARLPAAVAGAKAAALVEIMLASTLAGMAFGNADVGAVHCLSESIGGLCDLPHGLLNAVLLVPVLRAQGESAHGPLAALETSLRGGSSDRDADGLDADGLDAGSLAAAFLERLSRLAVGAGIPPFQALGVTPSRFDRIAALAESNGSNASNPRLWTAADYRRVLESVSGA